jgi:hypothetical protein
MNAKLTAVFNNSNYRRSIKKSKNFLLSLKIVMHLRNLIITNVYFTFKGIKLFMPIMSSLLSPNVVPYSQMLFTKSVITVLNKWSKDCIKKVSTGLTLFKTVSSLYANALTVKT